MTSAWQLGGLYRTNSFILGIQGSTSFSYDCFTLASCLSNLGETQSTFAASA